MMFRVILVRGHWVPQLKGVLLLGHISLAPVTPEALILVGSTDNFVEKGFMVHGFHCSPYCLMWAASQVISS